MKNWLPKYIPAFGAALAVLFLLTEHASAHTVLLEAQPPAGASLEKSPQEFRLTFDEPIVIGSKIDLMVGLFEPVEGVVSFVDQNEPMQLIAEVPPLAPGDYSVQWTVLSLDGHARQGSYTIQIRESTNGWRVGLWVGVAVVLLLFTGIRRWRREKSEERHAVSRE